MVEIRSTSLNILHITQVFIALYRTDSIQPPSNKPGINGPKKDQSYMVGEKICLYKAPDGMKHEEVLGMDLPFRLPLPTTNMLPGSISLNKKSVETSYQLFVSVQHGKQPQVIHEGFPVRIKRYDKLSMFRQFSIPVRGNVISPDHLVEFEYYIYQTSFGPRDSITSLVKILPNLDLHAKSKKVKLQKLSLQVVESITFNAEGGEPVEKRRKLCKATNTLDMKLSENGYRCEIIMDFPFAELRDKDGVVPQMRDDIPLVAYNGFTTATPLYKIEYFLVFKAKFSHCKDIAIEQPITVTPFDHVMCSSLMKSIKESVDEVDILDKNARMPAAKLYRPHDANTYMLFGVQRTGALSSGSKPVILIR